MFARWDPWFISTGPREKTAPGIYRIVKQADACKKPGALGAQTTDVLRLVVRQGMNPVILGLIIGVAGTFAVSRLLAAQLYQISPHNPLLLGAAAIVLAVAALLACLIPARRATLVDPIQALRTQ